MTLITAKYCVNREQVIACCFLKFRCHDNVLRAPTENYHGLFFEKPSNLSLNFSSERWLLPIAHAVSLITTNTIVSGFGTFGNLLVCVAVVTNARLRRSSNHLLASLAIADLIITVALGPLLVAILGKITFFILPLAYIRRAKFHSYSR